MTDPQKDYKKEIDIENTAEYLAKDIAGSSYSDINELKTKIKAALKLLLPSLPKEKNGTPSVIDAGEREIQYKKREQEFKKLRMEFEAIERQHKERLIELKKLETEVEVEVATKKKKPRFEKIKAEFWEQKFEKLVPISVKLDADKELKEIEAKEGFNIILGPKFRVTKNNRGRISAPFTNEEVLLINEFQNLKTNNMRTCKGTLKQKNNLERIPENNTSACLNICPNNGQLIATKDGMVCPCEKYKQGWAYRFMITPYPLKKYRR